MVVYIPGKGDQQAAADAISEHVNNFENTHPDAAVLIMGDFNWCDISKHLPGYTQYVNFSTRPDNTLDLLYCNIKNSYIPYKHQKLGSADHSLVYMAPVYKQKLKSGKVIKRTIKQWDKDSVDQLQGCLASTDWSIFLQDNPTLDQLTGVITDYISFCEDTIVPEKTIKIYPNTKPWITTELKSKIKAKHKLRLSQNKEEMKNLQRELDSLTDETKAAYKAKIEMQFQSNNAKAAWDGLKTITGYTKEKTPLESEDIEQLANDLNVFYTRFEKENNNTAGHNYEDLVVSTAISSDEVRSMFKSVNERKATGPDRISSKVQKVCNLELCDIFQFLFNESIVCGVIPSIWKTATIIPVPKKDKPTVMNDYRPVALTPVTMKCLEKIILSRLLPCITPSMDKLQFAYRQNRSIEDAIITVLNYIYQHLDTSGSYVRALFIDYSSAFNTIIPYILINKLKAYGVEPYLCSWISDFLKDRKQQVCIASQGQFVYSQMLTTNTGAPQGCVLSPVLFTMYTNDCTSHSVLCKLIKYADDSILLGLIKSENELAYRQEIINLSHWCKNHNLLLNVQKTKEVIFDFRKKC